MFLVSRQNESAWRRSGMILQHREYVASEILDAVVGSMGHVTVAPLTALWAGWLLTSKKTPGKIFLLHNRL